MTDPIRPFVYRIKQALREDAGEYTEQRETQSLWYDFQEYLRVPESWISCTHRITSEEVVHTVLLAVADVTVKFTWWWYHACKDGYIKDQWHATLWLNDHEVSLTAREQKKVMTAGEAALARRLKRKQDEIQAEIDAAVAKLEQA